MHFKSCELVKSCWGSMPNSYLQHNNIFFLSDVIHIYSLFDMLMVGDAFSAGFRNIFLFFAEIFIGFSNFPSDRLNDFSVHLY